MLKGYTVSLKFKHFLIISNVISNYSITNYNNVEFVTILKVGIIKNVGFLKYDL